ncbi:hypothetical protein VTK56DRAFT_1175 [Thermocarpiscus australiensis]
MLRTGGAEGGFPVSGNRFRSDERKDREVDCLQGTRRVQALPRCPHSVLSYLGGLRYHTRLEPSRGTLFLLQHSVRTRTHRTEGRKPLLCLGHDCAVQLVLSATRSWEAVYLAMMNSKLRSWVSRVLTRS